MRDCDKMWKLLKYITTFLFLFWMNQTLTYLMCVQYSAAMLLRNEKFRYLLASGGKKRLGNK